MLANLSQIRWYSSRDRRVDRNREDYCFEQDARPSSKIARALYSLALCEKYFGRKVTLHAVFCEHPCRITDVSLSYRTLGIILDQVESDVAL